MDVLFECDGMLSKSTAAHLSASGAFVLDLTMITGFNRTETTTVLWSAPNTDGHRGTYARCELVREFQGSCSQPRGYRAVIASSLRCFRPYPAGTAHVFMRFVCFGSEETMDRGGGLQYIPYDNTYYCCFLSSLTRP